MSSEKQLCAITGAGGYVGGCIKKHFLANGWDVLELTRQPKPGTHAVAFRLGADLNPVALKDVKALVHCAYDFKALKWEELQALNIQGSRKVFDAARAAGVKRIVYISSISAYEGCRSLYGKAKLEIERYALAAGALVVRPGLVYSDRPEAMFGKLVAQVRKSALLPIFGDGSQIQFLVHSEDLARLILAYAEGNVSAPSQPITAAHEQPWPFRELLLEIGRGLNRKPKFISVPWRLVWLVLKTAETCGLRLNFRSDSLVSLMYQNPKPDFSRKAAEGLVCRPFEIKKLGL